MQSLGITFDVILIALAFVLGAFTVIIKRQASMAVLLASYVAYVTVLVWGDTILGLINKQQVVIGGVSFGVSVGVIPLTALLFWVITFAVAVLGKLGGGGNHHQRSLPEAVVYSVVAVAVLAVLSVSIIPKPLQAQVLQGTNVLSFLFNYRDWVVAAPVALVILFSLRHGDE